MSRPDGGDALLLVESGGRRAALTLTGAAHVARVAAVYPVDGAAEVAAVAGRVIPARSLAAQLGWPAEPERWAVVFPPTDRAGGPVCLLVPSITGVVAAAKLDCTGPADQRRWWWRDPAADGAIVAALDAAALAGVVHSSSAPEPPPAGMTARYADGELHLPLTALAGVLSARRCPPLTPGRPAAGGGLRVIDGARLLNPAAPAYAPAGYLRLAGGRWALAAPELRLDDDATRKFTDLAAFGRRRLVGATIGWLPSNGGEAVK